MNLTPKFQWVKTDKLCDCSSPQEWSTNLGICQSCGREIFQGPRNVVEQHLYDKAVRLQATITTLTDRLREAEEVIAFYGNHKGMNHGIDYHNDETAFINEDDFEEIQEIEPNEWREDHYLVHGLRARAYLSKHKGKV